MVQLFESTKAGTIGKRAAVRGAIWSLVIHASLLLFVLSLAFSPVLPTLPDHIVRVMLAPPPPPPAPPPPPLTTARAVRTKRVVPLFSAKLTAPVAIPQHVPSQDVAIEVPPDIGVIGGVPGGIPGGAAGGVLGGVLGGTPPPIAAPPAERVVIHATTPPPEATPKRVQVSAEVQEAQLLEMIRPEYPKFAKVARVQGAVRLKAIIDKQGRITELKLVDGHPLLVPAALAAVEKWRYRPTLLNGEAVEVATEIIVKFRLVS